MLQNIQVYVVNLDRRPDRWKTVSTSLRRAGFVKVERVSAIDGKLIDSNHLKNLLHPRTYDKLGKIRKTHEELGSVGAVGCSLSHYKIWSAIAASGEPALVAEDDLVCHPLLNEFYITKHPEILKEYDYVMLGNNKLIREHNLLPSGYGKNQGIYRYNGMFFGTHFYYLTPEGARFFLRDFFPITYQVDSFMAFKLRKHSEFRAGLHYPDMGTQSNTTTDIQTPMDFNESVVNIVVSVNRQPNPIQALVVLVVLTVLFLMVFAVVRLSQIIIR